MEHLYVWVSVGLTVLIVVSIFNSLINKKNLVEFAYASIDAQLKKRYDLIPNLVSSCERYMGHEQTVLKELTATRTQFLKAGDADKVALEGQLTSQLRSVFALAENYPTLRAADTFTFLQRSLNEVEEQLAASRRTFNAAVTDYNNACQMFPTNVVARIMGYQPRKWFEAAAEEREVVKVWRQ